MKGGNSSGAVRDKNPANLDSFWAYQALVLADKYPTARKRFIRIAREAMKNMEKKARPDLTNWRMGGKNA